MRQDQAEELARPLVEPRRAKAAETLFSRLRPLRTSEWGSWKVREILRGRNYGEVGLISMRKGLLDVEM